MSERTKTHMTFVVGELHDGTDACCTRCANKTRLILSRSWEFAEEREREFEPYLEVADEVTAHYCETCGKITSLSFNEMT